LTSSSLEALTPESWEPDIGPKLTGAKRRWERQFLRSYNNCFAFNMADLGRLKGPGSTIDLAVDASIFWWPYRYSKMKRALIQARCQDLIGAGLVEKSYGEYASATVMPAKKDVHGNWFERQMCGDCCPINRQTKSDRYAMPIPQEIFDASGHAKVFSTLDLQAIYHQLPIRLQNRQKTAFWGIDPFGKDCLYQWLFLPFGLKNAPAEFQRVMDKILVGLDFVRCNIDDIVVYNDLVEEHKKHLKEVFGRLMRMG
jgi:hypothetical protein